MGRLIDPDLSDQGEGEYGNVSSGFTAAALCAPAVKPTPMTNPRHATANRFIRKVMLSSLQMILYQRPLSTANTSDSS